MQGLGPRGRGFEPQLGWCVSFLVNFFIPGRGNLGPRGGTLKTHGMTSGIFLDGFRVFFK